MSIITSGLAIFATTKIANSLYSKHANRFIKELSKKDDDNFLSDYIIDNHLLEHSINSLDNFLLKAYEKVSNDSNKYIIYVLGHDDKLSDYKYISYNFELLGYNSIFITNRDIYGYGIKESIDLIEWISYFIGLNNNIEITLYGYDNGANTIVYSLNSKLPINVKNIVLDEINSSYLLEKITQFCLDNNIDNSYKFTNKFYDALSSKMNIDSKELSLELSIKNNVIPICFIHNKLKNDSKYFDILKIYNSNKGIKKFFYTETFKKNYMYKNYFNVINKFINEHFR